MKIINVVLGAFENFEKVIQDILNSPEYSHLRTKEKGIFDSFYERLVKWLEDLILDAFGGEGYIQGDGKFVSSLFVIFIIVAVIALIIFILFKTKRSYGRRPKDILGEKIHGDTTPLSLRTRVEEALRQGDYREAVRLQYIALLLLLHEGKFLYLEDSMTNYEIYIKLKNNNFHSLDAFAYIMEVFNSVWYGNKKFTSLDYEGFKEKNQVLWNEVNKSEEAN